MVPKENHRSGRILGLDGLRAISIACVIWGHSVASLQATYSKTLPWFMKLGFAEIGVRVFFVISGFLITSLLIRELDSTGKINLKNFYIRRILRIFPAFYTYLACIALLTAVGFLKVAFVDFLCAGTFTWNYTAALFAAHDQGTWFLGHFWTLSLEEQFYLLWPLTFVVLGKKKAAYLAAAIIVFCPFMRVASYLLIPSSRGHEIMMLHTGADTLMFGCLAALCQGHRRFEQFVNSLDKHILPLVGAVFLAIISPLLAYRFKGMYTSPVGVTLESFFVIVIILYVAQRNSGFVARILNSAPLVWVGTLSYSLYLWQQLFVTPKDYMWVKYPLNLVFILAAATASFYLIEQPFLRLKNRLAKKEQSIATGAPVPELSKVQ